MDCGPTNLRMVAKHYDKRKYKNKRAQTPQKLST